MKTSREFVKVREAVIWAGERTWRLQVEPLTATDHVPLSKVLNLPSVLLTLDPLFIFSLDYIWMLWWLMEAGQLTVWSYIPGSEMFFWSVKCSSAWEKLAQITTTVFGNISLRGTLSFKCGSWPTWYYHRGVVCGQYCSPSPGGNRDVSQQCCWLLSPICTNHQEVEISLLITVKHDKCKGIFQS